MIEQLQTIEQIQTALNKGEVTSKDLTIMYLDRIAKYDQAGTTINSILEVNPDALHIAEALDVERQRDGRRGPLHGVPIVIKDNIDTADKMHTTAGSIALEHNYADEDAFLVKKLREAGAVILGKANLTEWANFMTIGMPNGYSSHGGQVLNPYGPGEFDVGGSSSGSAASVACGFVAGAIGTETSGSILSPASSNSVVGLKPTVGLISRTGVIPIAHSQDTAGPITRTVTDAAILLGALVGVDEQDPATGMSQGKFYKGFTTFLDPDGLQGARIGIDRTYLSELNEEEVFLVEQAMEDMKAQGAEIIEVSLSKEDRDSSVLFHEFKNGLNAYLAKCSDQAHARTLSKLIQYNENNEEVALKYGQKLLTMSEEKSGRLNDPEYISDRLADIEYSQKNGIDKALEEHQLDALLSANNLGAAMPAMAGYPSITVPAGYTASEGKPVGVTFTSTAFDEAKLITLGYAYEQTRSVTWQAPELTE
ncbi:amidase family protein [Pontibacillus marinus]|uniref:Amidase n=1 Tax=Pontibacillus marinus BH030004 = DSM 16465 TaxID=1385511 RepID=A0A0A5GBN8_9BACI|nr:amidase family protein [Pontibacillus marinus]KGX89449.1 amidase [Pontibacillus marinus BH030004 = DSM 16465]